jgi:hypothetical protein
MQKCFLIFSLFFVFLFACEREDSLFYQEVPTPNEIVVVEEAAEPVFAFRSSVDDQTEYIDTIGQIIDMGNNWYSIANVRYSTYECSSTTGGYSFDGTGDPDAGGNSSGFNFKVFINVSPGTFLFPNAIFFIPNENGVFEQYTTLCTNGEDIGNFVLDITSDDGERITGTFEATVYLAFDPVTFELRCGTPASIEKTITGAFDLPLQVCG